jgi:hypothetical protein
MGPILDVPICFGCKHYNRESGAYSAFPAEIPLAILLSRFDHREPFEGDGGIRFDPVTPEDAERAEEYFRNGAWPLPRDVNA